MVHFLGGAAVGAAPQLTYGFLLEELAAAGFAIVATPYALTFEHLECARRVAAEREAALAEAGDAFTGGQRTPLFGLGHSNGALLQLLMGSMGGDQDQQSGGGEEQGEPEGVDRVCSAVCLCSFNNRVVADAIPVLPEGKLPTEAAEALAQTRGTPLEGVFREAGAAARAALPGGVGGAAADTVAQFDALLFGELADGAQDFTPSPAESRAMVARAYAPRRTLLVSFDGDSLDDSPQIAEVLRGRPGANVRQLMLPGWHGEPCGFVGTDGAEDGLRGVRRTAANVATFFADAAAAPDALDKQR